MWISGRDHCVGIQNVNFFFTQKHRLLKLSKIKEVISNIKKLWCCSGEVSESDILVSTKFLNVNYPLLKMLPFQAPALC